MLGATLMGALNARCERMRPAAAAMLEAQASGRLTRPLVEIVQSLAHMQVNRMFVSQQRAHELLLYHCAASAYRARLGRDASQAGVGGPT